MQGDTALNSLLFFSGISVSFTYKNCGVRENTRSAICFTYVDRVYIHGDRQSVKALPSPRANSFARGPSHAHTTQTPTHRMRKLPLVQTLCAAFATHEYEASSLTHREHPARAPAAQEPKQIAPAACSSPTSTWTRRKAKARRLVAACAAGPCVRVR